MYKHGDKEDLISIMAMFNHGLLTHEEMVDSVEKILNSSSLEIVTDKGGVAQ